MYLFVAPFRMFLYDIEDFSFDGLVLALDVDLIIKPGFIRYSRTGYKTIDTYGWLIH